MCTNVSSELNINCKSLQVPRKGKMIILISAIIGKILTMNGTSAASGEREKSVRKLNIWIKVIIEKFAYFNIREDFFS